MPTEPQPAQSTTQYGSILEAVEDGVSIASWIAEVTGKPVSTVRKTLRRYELDGVLLRHHGNGTVECPDVWEVVPPERREEARRTVLAP